MELIEKLAIMHLSIALVKILMLKYIVTFLLLFPRNVASKFKALLPLKYMVPILGLSY